MARTTNSKTDITSLLYADRDLNTYTYHSTNTDKRETTLAKNDV